MKVEVGFRDLIKLNCYSKLMIVQIQIWVVQNFRQKQLKWMVYSIEIKILILIFIIGIRYLLIIVMEQDIKVIGLNLYK